jgi:Bacteriophage clamp loader A subunit
LSKQLLDVTLQPRKEEKKEVITKPNYDWRYENSINTGKEYYDLNQPQEFKYSQWRTNLSLSNFIDTLSYANEMNCNYHISDKFHYEYLYHSVRKAKRYGKKKTEYDKQIEKQIKEEQEKISLISEHYKYNIVRAKEVLKVLTSEQFELIKKKQEKGGIK